MMAGSYPVSLRIARYARDNWYGYRRRRLDQLIKSQADFDRMMDEERALLEWSRHHLDELIRRLEAEKAAGGKKR